MEPFATVEDYEARYGEVDDDKRISTLLSDASAFVASQPGFAVRDGDDLQAAALMVVTCSLVYRKVTAGDYAGLSSVSQGGGGYTASVSVYNPSGDFFLTKQERRTLGIGGGRVGQTDPYGGDDDD